MTAVSKPDISLFARADLDQTRAANLLANALLHADDGELFLEYKQTESLVFDNGKLKVANTDTKQGFGLRAVRARLWAMPIRPMCRRPP